jgi:hypothetical protein
MDGLKRVADDGQVQVPRGEPLQQRRLEATTVLELIYKQPAIGVLEHR